MDVDCTLRLLSIPDENMITVACTLNLTLFKDSLPKKLEDRPAWTSSQRGKATGCDALRTVDELSTWVCCSKGFQTQLLIINDS